MKQQCKQRQGNGLIVLAGDEKNGEYCDGWIATVTFPFKPVLKQVLKNRGFGGWTVYYALRASAGI